jgi:predicted nucleic acid-binding protein
MTPDEVTAWVASLRPEETDWSAVPPLGLGDALIAGVATTLDATVVTRNRPDFARQGVAVLG